MTTPSSSPDDPPYVDVFDGQVILENNEKLSLLTAKWDKVQHFIFPSRCIGGKFRKIQSHWFVKNTWLRYSKSAKGVYCAPCHLFAEKRENIALASLAATDPSNVGKLITKHAGSTRHIDSQEAAENFVKIMKGEKKDIVSCISSNYSSLVEKNRQILVSIVDTIILCGRQNLALRGHEDQEGNFMALLDLQSKHNTILREHLLNGDPRTRYTSPKVQNELIDICGQLIQDEIVQSCNRAPCYGFIADEATDASTMEQMAMCVRFYDQEKNELREDFIGFSECLSTTGEALATAFLENLQRAGIDIEKMRGQGYDGAANMSGKYKGVQARVREIVPDAIYTHCKAHNLNLAIIHACKEQCIRNMMNVVQEIAFGFNYSAKRLLRFQETLAGDAESKEEMDNRRKLQSLCETRWAARADALKTFKAAYTTVVHALQDLSDNYGDTKAGTHLMAVLQFNFIITLIAAEHALSSLAPLSLILQKKTCDLIEAAAEARVVHQLLSDERNDPAVWDELFIKAVEMGEKVDVEPTRPRGAARMQHRQNIPADTISDFWKRNMYFPFIDHLLAEIQIRLLQGGNRFLAQHLIPSRANDLTVAILRDIYTEFQRDLPAEDDAVFVREGQRWAIRCESSDDKPDRLIDTLAHVNTELYPNIFKCLNILLSMPVSTATAKRSFSSMRRLKTYLRATMTTERLSGLGLMNIHRDRELSAEHVVDIFARRKDRRLALLFRV